MINNAFKKKNGYNYPLYLSFQPALCQIGLSMKIRNSNSNIKKKDHISGCFASGRTAWWVGDESQESHLHSVTHCWKWDVIKTVADADDREKNEMPESSGPNSSAERVVWTPSNPKSPVKIYLGLWSVDGKNADLEVKLYASCVSYS